MLTSDLLRNRVSGSTISPQLIDAKATKHLNNAAFIVALWAQAHEEGWPRRKLTGRLDDWVGLKREHKMLRGIAKIYDDRCEWSSHTPMDPVALRQEVFLAARERGPLALTAGLLGRPTADDVLQDVAKRHDTAPEVVSEALYADLKSEQRLTAVRDDSPSQLLQRYNVALCQSLLLHATQMTLTLTKPTAPRMRQLFRCIKFHQLMQRARRRDDNLEVILDGPASLFRQSTRYGLQFANFFPALLLQDGAWKLEAEVLWTRAKHRKTLVLDPSHGLVSHYRDTGAWRSKTCQHFEARFAETQTDWTLHEGEAPIRLGGQDIFFPDYTLRRGDACVHLDIVGFWQRDWLHRRMEWLQRHGPKNLLLAVSRRLQGSKEALDEGPVSVIDFAEILSVKRVLDAAQTIVDQR